MAVKDYIFDEEKYYHLRIKRDDFFKVLRLEGRIEELLRQEYPKVQKEMQDALSLFKVIEIEATDIGNDKGHKIIDRITARFVNDKRVVNSGSVGIIRKAIDKTVVALLHNEYYHGRIANKKDFLRKYYNILAKILNSSPMKKDWHSTIGAILACLALECSYDMPNTLSDDYKKGIHLKNDDLFQAVRSQIEKFRNKNR